MSEMACFRQLRIGFVQYCRGDSASQSARNCNEWAALPASFDIKRCWRPGYGVCFEIFVCRSLTSVFSISELANRALDIASDTLLSGADRHWTVVGISARPPLWSPGHALDVGRARYADCSIDFVRTSLAGSSRGSRNN